mgnify:CR=1 FL=1
MINSVRLTTAGDRILESTPTGNDVAMVVSLFCNTSARDTDTINVYVVKSGDTPSDNNIIVKDYVISPADTFEMESEKIILSGGDYILAKSLKGYITATVSYMEL